MYDEYILVHSHISFTFKSNDVINLISFKNIIQIKESYESLPVDRCVCFAASEKKYSNFFTLINVAIQKHSSFCH